MPTLSARHFLKRRPENLPVLAEQSPIDADGLTAMSDGKLILELHEILDMVAAHDLILCSGHLEPSETIEVFHEARKRGVERLVVTHPHGEVIGATAAEMRELAELGAYNEFAYGFTTPFTDPPQPIDLLARYIRAVGVDHCFLSTDSGQAINPRPVEMYLFFIHDLLKAGFAESEVESMAQKIPGQLLELKG